MFQNAVQEKKKESTLLYTFDIIIAIHTHISAYIKTVRIVYLSGRYISKVVISCDFEIS